MYPQTAPLINLAVTNALIGGALTAAWRRFGRERHALLWAASFFVVALSDVARCVHSIRPVVGITLHIVSDGGLIVGMGLLALGFRYRAGLSEKTRAIAAGTIASVGLTATAILVAPNREIPQLVPDTVMGLAFFVSALAVHGTDMAIPPRIRARITTCVLLSGALYSAVLTGLAVAILGHRTGAVALYDAVFLIGTPPLATATGLSAILLIGGDLAQRYHRLAEIDPLTGIPNRRGVDRAAARLIAQARRSHRPLSLVVADLDRFKAINDRHGHQIGDQVLRRFAAHGAAELRGADLIGRLGGEEFVFLLTDSGAASTAAVMERLRGGLAMAVQDLAVTLPVTASFGIATLGGRGDSLEDMIARADVALYRSKNEGRDRISFAAPRSQTDSRFQAAWRRETLPPVERDSSPTGRRAG